MVVMMNIEVAILTMTSDDCVQYDEVAGYNDDDYDDEEDVEERRATTRTMAMTRVSMMLTKSPGSQSLLLDLDCVLSITTITMIVMLMLMPVSRPAETAQPALKELALADITAPRLFTKIMPPERAEPTVMKTVSFRSAVWSPRLELRSQGVRPRFVGMFSPRHPNSTSHSGGPIPKPKCWSLKPSLFFRIPGVFQFQPLAQLRAFRLVWCGCACGGLKGTPSTMKIFREKYKSLPSS